MGMQGYKQKVQNQLDVTSHFREKMRALKWTNGEPMFEISDADDEPGLPVVSCRVNPKLGLAPHIDDFSIQNVSAIPTPFATIDTLVYVIHKFCHKMIFLSPRWYPPDFVFVEHLFGFLIFPLSHILSFVYINRRLGNSTGTLAHIVFLSKTSGRAAKRHLFARTNQ